MRLLRTVWKALTEPHADPQALACPVCGGHRFKPVQFREGYLTCRGCGEELPDTELVTRADNDTRMNYMERTYG